MRYILWLALIGLAFFAASSNRPKDPPYYVGRWANAIGITEQEFLEFMRDPLAPIPASGNPDRWMYREMQTKDDSQGDRD